MSGHSLRDGLYKVDFQTQLGAGTGFAAFHNGTVSGGDRGMIYTGCFDVVGDRLSVIVVVEQRPDRSTPSVFRAERAVVSLSGRAGPYGAELAGVSAEAPDILFQAHLTYLPD